MPLLDKTKNSPSPFLRRALDRLDESRGQGAHTALLAALSQALTSCEKAGKVEPAFVQLLPEILRISDSQFGFLAEVCYSATGIPYLESHAVIDVYKANFGPHDIVSGLQFHNLETLNGAILTSRQAVVANDPSTDPRSGGLPFGHARLDAYLGLPFLLDGELVGAVALANRPKGYSTTQVQLLAPLCEIGALLIASCRSQ